MNEWMQKFIAFCLSLLAMAGLVIGIRKEAADAREDEIKRDDAEDALKEIKEAKEIENKINSFTNDSKRDRLRKFFKKTK